MVELEGIGHIIRYINPAFCRLVGKDQKALIGKPFAETVQEGDQVLSVLGRVYRTADPETHTELEQVAPHPAYWSYAIWPVLGTDQRPTGVMMQVTETTLFHQQTSAMNRELMLSSVHQHELTEVAEKLNGRLRAEIAERKQAQEASATLAAIVESSDDAILSIDLHGNIISWNKGAERLFGYAVQETIGRPMNVLIPPDRIDEEPALLERIRQGESIEHYETVRRRKDGTLLDISLTISPIVDSQSRIVGASKIARDITERKKTEEGLRALATELNLAEQRERNRLATELHDYLAQLLVLCRITLGQAKRAGLPPRAEDFVKETERTLGTALTYCRTLMAELSPPVLRDQGLVPGLKWLAENMKKHELTVTMTVPEDGEYKIPEDQVVLLFQSVRELLINSAKHAGTGQATVTLAKHDSVLQIEVQDQGMGFELNTVAVAAAHTSPLSSKFGLFSIRERMKALGGNFDIRSTPGQGTSATLTLPMGRKPPEQNDEQRRMSDEPKQTERSHSGADSRFLPVKHRSPDQKNAIRVLLVDDQKIMRQGLRSIVMTSNNLEIVGEAGDGMEAVKLAQQLDPDVVVMDINMPRMDGIEATKRIKADRPDIVIIGLSVLQSEETDQKMRAAGAAAYLTKDNAADALCKAIEGAVSYQWGTARQTCEERA